jgi:hypothetical protein
MDAVATAIVCVAALAWVLVGSLTMFRHSTQKRRVARQLDGRLVDLEYRVGQSRITARDVGYLSAQSRWHVGLSSPRAHRTIPIPAIRSIRECDTGAEYGPWT